MMVTKQCRFHSQPAALDADERNVHAIRAGPAHRARDQSRRSRRLRLANHVAHRQVSLSDDTRCQKKGEAGIIAEGETTAGRCRALEQVRVTFLLEVFSMSDE